MDEVTARLAIYGAVDVEVRESDLDVRPLVAQVLPVYDRPPEEIDGWYPAMASRGIPLADDPRVQEALDDLSTFDDPSDIDAGHRFEALWVAHSVFSATLNIADNLGAAANALTPSGDDGNQLLREVFEPATPDTPVRALAERAVERHLLAEQVALLVGACQEGTVYYPVRGSDDVDVAAQIISSFELSTSSFDLGGPFDFADVRAAMWPDNWDECLPTFWLGMEPQLRTANDLAKGQHRFVERVGTPADSTTGAAEVVWFHPCLRFADTIDLEPATTFVIAYDLCDQGPEDPNVLADSGLLQVSLRGAGAAQTLRVDATKTIALSFDLPSAGLALFACVAGWLDQSKAMAKGCLVNHGLGP